jgi:prepilin-type N-terminal cleavage/methylation domain-containing protein
MVHPFKVQTVRRGSRGGDAQAGVTAVELMVVLVILALLMLATYPMLSNVLLVMASKGAAEQTAGAIRLARQFGITRASNHCIEFGPGGTPPFTQYRIREADTASPPACNGSVIPGYNWKDISHNENVVTTATTMVFDPIGNRVVPGGAGSTTFNVDTSPSSCLSTITVTLYGGVRVSGC